MRRKPQLTSVSTGNGLFRLTASIAVFLPGPLPQSWPARPDSPARSEMLRSSRRHHPGATYGGGNGVTAFPITVSGSRQRLATVGPETTAALAWRAVAAGLPRQNSNNFKTIWRHKAAATEWRLVRRAARLKNEPCATFPGFIFAWERDLLCPPWQRGSGHGVDKMFLASPYGDITRRPRSGQATC